MIVKYFDGALPAPTDDKNDSEAKVLRTVASGMGAAVESFYEKFAVGAACGAAMEVVRAVDTYIEQTQPFRLAKDPAKLGQLATVLYHCAEALRIASLGLWPVMPWKIEALWTMLGIGYDTAGGNFHDWCAWGQLKPGTRISKTSPLFPRIVIEA
jgi:methionyl-tRNA synthetase